MFNKKYSFLLAAFIAGTFMFSSCGTSTTTKLETEAEQPVESATKESKEVKDGIIRNISIEEFNTLVSSDSLVMVDFHATWCGPCKKMAPHLEKIQKDQDGKVKIVKIDIDENQLLAQHFNITQIPTLKTYAAGKQVHDTLGYLNEDALLSILTPHLN